jgi:outer membrane receptor for ferrienterochelin and colicin
MREREEIVMTRIALTRTPRALRPILLVILCLVALPLFAQFDTGTIAGSVTDSSGAAIPNVTISVTNTGTGIHKTFHTDGGGKFGASAIPFGNYIVSANATGFAEAKSQAIVLNVGANANVNLVLAVAGASQTVEVTGTTTTVDLQSTTAGTTLNSTQVANLPINGRDVSNFLEIAPGSVGSAGFFQGSVNGMENIFTGLNVTVDGQNASRGDINGFLDTQGQELARVTRASIDSIQEINFANSGFSAEYGRSLGPQMNIITKSGTNQFHGTAFEFLRNDALDAKDYFNNGKKSPLRLNQFGGNLSGPIVKNKLFFFVNYEGDRTHITNLNSLYEIPSALVRSKMLAQSPALAPIMAQMAPLPAGCTTIPAPPSCAVAGTEEKKADGKTPTGGGAQLVYSPAALPDILREDTGSVKVDYNISDKDRIFFRYNINDSLTTYTYGLNQGQVSPQSMRTQLAKIDETHTFSPTLLNQFSIGLNRFYSSTNSNTPDLVGFSGFFTNLGALPGPNTYNQITPFNTFEVFDTVTKTAGNHTLKFGAQIRANQLNEYLRPQQTYSYASFSDLENNQPFALQKVGFPGFVGITSSNWSFYAQDDWRVSRNLTLNIGIRYDYNTVWSERHNHQANFDYATQSFMPGTQDAYNAPKGDIAPRIGFSWDPFGKGKTVIHGYGGLFYMPMHFGFGLVGNDPAYASYTATVFDAFFGGYSIQYPSPNPPQPPANVRLFPRNPKDPVSTNWMLGIQQEIAKNTVFDLKYVGNHAVHMQAGVDFAAINLNPSNSFTGARPLPGYASENYDCDCLSSNYNSLQAQVRHNIGRLNFEANYTWSHEIDDMVNVFSGWSNPYNPNADRGSGDWDVRHNLTGSIVYSLPDLKGGNWLERGALGGWQVSSIFQARSGLPVNVTMVSGFFGVPVRPNVVPGQTAQYSDVNWAYPGASYNVNAFSIPALFDGTPGQNMGDAGRNSLSGPAFFQWDMSLAKNFPITEAVKLQFRTDIFNILNHPNFAPPDGGICTSVTAYQPPTSTSPAVPASCVVNPNFGRVGQTIADNMGSQIGNGTSRQFQFSLKLIF